MLLTPYYYWLLDYFVNMYICYNIKLVSTAFIALGVKKHERNVQFVLMRGRFVGVILQIQGEFSSSCFMSDLGAQKQKVKDTWYDKSRS